MVVSRDTIDCGEERIGGLSANFFVGAYVQEHQIARREDERVIISNENQAMSLDRERKFRVVEIESLQR